MKWQRIARLVISGKAGSITVDCPVGQDHLKLDFDVTKTIGSSPNPGTITVWNLSKEHRGMLGEELDKAELFVGYQSTGLGLLFKGDIREAEHDMEGGDISSKLTLGDGDKAMANSGVSKTFPKGTKPEEAIKFLAGKMTETSLGKLEGLSNLPSFTQPVSFFGHVSRELNELSRQFGFYWSIQNGVLEAVKNDQAFPETTLISKETGMVGIPTSTDKGVKVKTLLDLNIAPNRIIQVKSGWLDSGKDYGSSDQGGGLFRVSTVKHSGSTRGQDWYSVAEGNRMQGGKVVK